MMNLLEKIKNARLAVKSSLVETLYLYEKYNEIVKWKGNGGGIITVGELNNLPVNIEIEIVYINDIPVMFWHGCSIIVDYKQIDDWCQKNGFSLNYDAMNFNNVINEIKRIRS